jgi:hypothetical protein
MSTATATLPVSSEQKISHSPRSFWVAAGIYTATVVAILIASFRAADGHFIYALDDTYINMAMAKNFALHGVWGVTPYAFSSATSTPFFVLLLSLVYRLTGPSQYVPLILSWIFGLASIYVAAGIVARYLNELWQSVTLIAMVLFTPLFVVGTLGMEHSLHILLTLLFLREFDQDAKPLWVIAIITALLTGTRYEGMFMVAVGCLMLAVRRKWMRAAIIALAAWLPICSYAVFSIAQHGYWLPNSIALKGVHVHGLSIGELLLNLRTAAIWNSIHGMHLFLLLAGIVLAAIALRTSRSHLFMMLAVVAGAGYFHLLTADVGWAFRYEDYLIAAAIIVGACSMPALHRSSKLASVVAAYIFFGAAALLTARSVQAAASLPRYSRAIYQQQWQMANFLRKYYPNGAIAANDIGLINYMNDLHCLDLVGLADTEVFQAKHAGMYSTQFVDQEASKRGIEVAMIYDSWFTSHPVRFSDGPPVPGTWIPVARWKVKQGEQLGDDTVSFYALTPAAADRLRTQLASFAKNLPSDVTPLP